MGNCNNTIKVEQSIDTVWETIKDFHDMSWATDVITSVTKVGEKSGYEPGAKRVLNDAFYETLIEIDANNYTFSYSIDDGPRPVSSSVVEKYIGVVKLSKSGDGTLVEWNSVFTSENDYEVAEFCTPIYTACLQSLKKTLNNFTFISTNMTKFCRDKLSEHT